MNNVLLGKTVKAMYKLSGKTLTQLSDETDMTVDTINNLFYARLLKPGYQMVEELVKATGHTMAELDGFLSAAQDLPTDADVTEELARYLIAVREEAKEVSDADRSVDTAGESVDSAVQGMHRYYEEQMRNQYKEQIAHMAETYEREIERLGRTNRSLKRINLGLLVTLVLVVVGMAIVMLFQVV